MDLIYAVSKVIPDLNRINRALILIAVILAASFAVHSAWLGYDLLRPLIVSDQIAAVDQYFDYLAGNLNWKLLVRFHNEHRLALPRLTFLIDAIFFDFTNRFVIPFIYAVFFILSVAMATLASRRPYTYQRIAAACTIALGLGWCISQRENLSWGFQTQWPLVHLFAVASLASFAQLLLVDTTRRRVTWCAAAFAFNLCAAFSSAGGLLVGIATIPLCIWLRRWNTWVIVYLAAQVILMVIYLNGVPPPPVPGPVSVGVLIKFFLLSVGALARLQPHAVLLLGVSAVALSISLMTLRAWDGIARFPDAVLLSIAAFVLLECAATSMGRASMGHEQAVVSRYAMPSALLVGSLLAICWREARGEFAKSAVLVATIGTLILANPSQAVDEWKDEIGVHDAAIFSFINGIYAPVQTRIIFPNHDYLLHDYKRLLDAAKGPFAYSAAFYQPPLNYLASLNRAELPLCRGNIDQADNKDGNWTDYTGWMTSHSDKRAPIWMIAYSEGRVIGFTKPYIRRPDISKAFNLFGDRFGWSLFLKKVDTSVQVVSIFSNAKSNCSFIFPRS